MAGIWRCCCLGHAYQLLVLSVMPNSDINMYLMHHIENHGTCLNWCYTFLIRLKHWIWSGITITLICPQLYTWISRLYTGEIPTRFLNHVALIRVITLINPWRPWRLGHGTFVYLTCYLACGRIMAHYLFNEPATNCLMLARLCVRVLVSTWSCAHRVLLSVGVDGQGLDPLLHPHFYEGLLRDKHNCFTPNATHDSSTYSSSASIFAYLLKLIYHMS